MSVTAVPRRTGFVFEEKYMWHNPGVLPGTQWYDQVNPALTCILIAI